MPQHIGISESQDNPSIKPDWMRDGEARLRDYETEERRQEQERDEAKKSPYTRKGFTQFSDAEIVKLRKLTIENPTATAIFLFLTEHMSTYNAVSCSHSLLMKITGKSRATVSKAVSILKKSNFIGIKKVGSTQVFHLNANIVWHSYGSNIRWAELTAPILLDPQENPELEDIKIEKGRINILSCNSGDEEEE